MFGEMISFCVKIYQPQKFGSLICVPVAERSSNAKARVLAMTECRFCVEKVGLNAIGKRGMLHVCKTLSEEPLVENRIAALDLIEEIIRKLNGDTKRFYIACGNSLSDKAKGMIEERWSKHNSPNKDTKESDAKAGIRRKESGAILDTRTTDSTAKPDLPRRGVFTPTRGSSQKSDYLPQEGGNSAGFKLHLDEMNKTVNGAEAFKSEEGPFMFRYNAYRALDFSADGINSTRFDDKRLDRVESNSSVAATFISDKEVGAGSPFPPVSLLKKSYASEDGVGEGKPSPKISSSAASLRARLKKIRDRASLDPNQPPPALESSHKVRVGSPSPPQQHTRVANEAAYTYGYICEKIDAILGLCPPIFPTDPGLTVAINAMEQLQFSVGSDDADMKTVVKSDILGFVSRLTRQAFL